MNSKMIEASSKIGVEIMVKMCQLALDGKGIPNDWKTNVVWSRFTMEKKML